MWASKEDVLPEPPWDWSGNSAKERENTQRLVGSLISKAEKNGVKTVYIATDPDREGEFIAWRLAEIFSDFETKRVTFNEVTKNAIMNAIENPRDVDMNLVEAAKVRRFMDRLVGYRAS
jgi:DNA topoisomerase-1